MIRILLFKLLYGFRSTDLKPKDHYQFLGMLDTRDFHRLIDAEQKMMQDLYFRKNSKFGRQNFMGGYMELEKLRLEVKDAKKKYFRLESIERNESESDNI